MYQSILSNPLLVRRKAACVPLIAGLACLVMSTPSSAATLGQNLVINGDAEQGLGDPVGNAVGTVIPVTPGWTPLNSFSVLQYGASGFEFTNLMGQPVRVSGLPDAASPGPANRGNNFFYGGGDRASSSATQTIDISNLSQAVDSKLLTFTLSGWLGGYQTDQDSASLVVSFLSVSGTILGSSSITAPTPAQRNNITGLSFQSLDGLVPVDTRQAQVLLNMDYTRGRVNDAYADNLSLTVAAVPEPTTILGTLLAGSWVIAYQRRRLRQSHRSK